MKKTKETFLDLVDIIRDVSNGNLDYKLPRTQAKALYEAGKLCFDLTNGKYSHFEPCEPKFEQGVLNEK